MPTKPPTPSVIGTKDFNIVYYIEGRNIKDEDSLHKRITHILSYN